MRPEGRIRRISRRIGAAICSALLTASAAFGQEAELSAPAVAAPGAAIEVTWQGPDAPGDFIAISDPSAPAAQFEDYARTSAGSPAALTAPEAGEYEVRYIAATGLQILARAPLSVGAGQAQAGISAPAEVEAGAVISVSVAELGDPADYVTIVGAGEPDDAFGPYARLHDGAEVALTAPDTAGSYEIRHIRASAQTVLARAPLIVVAAPAPTGPETQRPAGDAAVGASGGTVAATGPTPPHASLMALLAVDRARTFRVAWTGPGAEGDRIAIIAEGEAPDTASNGEATQGGSPVSLTAPDSAGEYEIIYLDGASGEVLARRGLEVR